MSADFFDRFRPVKGTLSQIEYITSSYHHIAGVMGVLDEKAASKIEKSEVLRAFCELEDAICLIDAEGNRLDHCKGLELYFSRASNILQFGSKSVIDSDIDAFIATNSWLRNDALRGSAKKYSARILLPDDLFDKIKEASSCDLKIEAVFELDHLQNIVKMGKVEKHNLPDIFITQDEQSLFLCHGVSVTTPSVLSSPGSQDVQFSKRSFSKKLVAIMCITLVYAAAQYAPTSIAIVAVGITIFVWLSMIEDNLANLFGKKPLSA